MIEITKGNLLQADAEALVNTVNTVGVMGKGIALQFKQAFPENFKAYYSACKREEVKVGRLFVFETNSLHNPRYLLNFPTKKHWKGDSRLDYVDAGLEDLVRVLREYHIASVAIPPLGCGHGGLAWAKVFPRIAAALEQLPEVRALIYPPEGAPAVEERTSKTRTPRLTQARAAILALMGQYALLGYRLTMLEVQKLAYFLQEAGEGLNLQFKKHLYGPYADALRHVVNDLEGHYVQGDGDGNVRPSSEVALMEGAWESAEKAIEGHPDTRARFERVTKLIEGFETPYGMELLASVHWIAKDDLIVADDPEAAVSGVHAWNKRKNDQFKAEHIRTAWHRLNEQGWL